MPDFSDPCSRASSGTHLPILAIPRAGTYAHNAERFGFQSKQWALTVFAQGLRPSFAAEACS